VETRAIHPAADCLKPHKFLPYDANAVIDEMPAVSGLVGDLMVPFAFCVDRKLYIHNLGPCLCAYFGEIEVIVNEVLQNEVINVAL